MLTSWIRLFRAVRTPKKIRISRVPKTQTKRGRKLQPKLESAYLKRTSAWLISYHFESWPQTSHSWIDPTGEHFSDHGRKEKPESVSWLDGAQHFCQWWLHSPCERKHCELMKTNPVYREWKWKKGNVDWIGFRQHIQFTKVRSPASLNCLWIFDLEFLNFVPELSCNSEGASKKKYVMKATTGVSV